MNIKKGAMFGLDARIALAIFGALSVISGAALYSAIQESKLTSVYTTLKEVIKGYEALYIDTGSIPIITAPDVYDPNALLTDSGDAGWNGPYYTGGVEIDIPGHYSLVNIGLPENYYVRARYLRDNTWNPSSGSWGNDVSCNATAVGLNCSLWIQVKFGDDISFAASLDKKFDDDSEDTGNIRYGHQGDNYIYINGISLGIKK